METSNVYYFWTAAETNTWGVTIAESSEDNFSILEELTIDELAPITATDGGNGEGPAWGDAVVSNDGERIFVNARNADKVVVFDNNNFEVETILDVGDRPVHSFIYEDEIWVHVDGDGGFNVINQDSLEVSEVIEANTVGTGHGKLLVAPGLGAETYVTNTAEPAVFPINLETKTVSAPIEIGGGDPELGTHDKGYDPATQQAFFQLTDGAGYTFIDTTTNEVVLDQHPIQGRVAHTPNNEYILILNKDAETEDVGIWNTQLETHTLPDFDATATVGGGVSVHGTEFYQDGETWEAWFAQTADDHVAILNLETNAVEYIEVGGLTAPEGARHFSRRGATDDEYFFTHADDGGKRIDLDTNEVSEAISLPEGVSRLAVVSQQASLGGTLEPIFGSLADDALEAGIDFSGEGNPVFSGAGNDTVEVSTGNGGNRIYGGNDNDELITGSNDRAFGGEGDDFLESSLGSENRLYGGTGNDTVIAGYKDRVIAGDGNDRLFLSVGEIEGGGENMVTGGTGADQFWIANAQIPAAVNQITDFNPDEDVLGIGGIDSVAEFANLTITQDGSDTLIRAADTELARLLGINADNLSANQFAIQASAELI